MGSGGAGGSVDPGGATDAGGIAGSGDVGGDLPDLRRGRLSIDVGPGQTIALSGELDIATAPDLHATVERLRAAGRTQLQIDLSGVTFCDSSGLGALIWAHNTMITGGQVVLVNLSPLLQQLVRLTGLDTVLHLSDGEPPRPLSP